MYQDNLFNKLIVDNFAGGGGASTGIELATGRPVDIAINMHIQRRKRKVLRRNRDNRRYAV